MMDDKWSELLVQQTLKRSALLGMGMGMGMGIGLVVCRVQKNIELENAEKEIKELKQRRSEDAKANEKVVSIFAAKEYSWCAERKKLRLQIDGLINELRVVKKSREESVSEFELVLHFKAKLMEESDQKLRASERLVEELKECVCKQEAEMGRTARKLEEAKREVECKEQLVLVNRRLSIEIVKMHKVLEKKDEVLRKSGLGADEKQVVLKDLRRLKATVRKEVEVETAGWNAESECKDEGRNVLSKHGNEADAGIHKNEYKHQDMRTVLESKAELENCVSNTEAEKHKIANEQRQHQVENDVFEEQLRQRDEKLESASRTDHVQHRNNQKISIHAPGVSYNTLLKHQLIMLESLTPEKQEICENKTCAFMSLMNKQLDHYQSLQRKIDHLCITMHENKQNSKSGSKEDEMQRMEPFLEQTFQLQRYVVATGQKLVQLQLAAKVGTSLVADNTQSIQALFRQVQRGLELRISRVIGDLERALTVANNHYKKIDY